MVDLCFFRTQHYDHSNLKQFWQKSRCLFFEFCLTSYTKSATVWKQNDNYFNIYPFISRCQNQKLRFRMVPKWCFEFSIKNEYSHPFIEYSSSVIRKLQAYDISIQTHLQNILEKQNRRLVLIVQSLRKLQNHPKKCLIPSTIYC